MAHYNLYDTLGLDRSASTSDLRGELDSRLATGPFDNPGGEEEVKLASNILGDERKREVYDKRLGELDAEPITVPALRQLAEMNLGGTGAAPQAHSGNGFDSAKQSFATAREDATSKAHALGEDYKNTSTQVIVVTAVAAGLVGIILGGILF
ncbi:Hypothetical protein NG00_01788 [Corynebacterium camporealensis]|uniref:Uncharacterized protein n=1 Tax=Corynebacterium camporealensis TaxID=161896 RepID=A0A0F6QY47_9CORY|nr:hypothetical protein [Corynebacterium camporealensis]AKE39930.1 hypothetical protein UL81_09980 [Corynebacterium camporealensis]AVH89027.1 Hypothetical protein NG00_01788 [Corynebacterium camporealensis]